MAPGAGVETEDELLKAFGEVFRLDSSLRGAVEPAFQQREHRVKARQQFMGREARS